MRSLLFNSLVVSSILIFECDRAFSQVTPDSSLGDESSVVNTRDATSDSIDGGAIRGQNLFHSFEEFNVGEDRGVYFANPDAVTNIFSRVTGSNVSNILGTLGVDGAANLFLINPNGIVFGEGASLDVQGSFTATTADGVEFGEQGFFSVSNPESPKLLTINPSAYLFNQVAPGAIANSSQASADSNPETSFDDDFFGLRVPDGQNLLLLGGDVSANGGGLVASGGRIDIGAVTGQGVVGLNNNGSLNIPDSISRGNVSLTNGAGFLVAGDGGGDIDITANNISLDSASTIEAGIYSNLGSPDAQAGDLNLNAIGTISVKDDNSFISNDVFSGATGTAGNVTIDTNQLILSDGGQIGANTFGQGNGGNVTIRAFNIELKGTISDGQLYSGLFTTVQPDGVGNAGKISLTTSSLNLIDGGTIDTSTYGQGNAGSIKINATDNINLEKSGISSGVDLTAVGDSGQISLTTSSLNLTNVGVISTTTYGQGNAGSIKINATGNINFEESGVLSSVDSRAVGNGGQISLTTSSLNLKGGIIDASTSGQGDAGGIIVNATDAITLSKFSGVSSYVDEQAVGDGGAIKITTGSLNLIDSAIDTTTFSRGNAGSIKINTTDNINFDGKNRSSGVFSSVESTAIGDGGEISLTTSSLNLTNNGRIDTSTSGQGDAGGIIINATDNITFNGKNSTSNVFSSVESTAIGNGGEIFITTSSLNLTNGGFINTGTSGQGDAGGIIINATDNITFSKTSGILSEVDSTAVGDGGGVSLTTNSLNLTNGGVISTSTYGRGNASGIEITTSSLNLIDGGVIDTTTFGQGNAGGININASDAIIFDGANGPSGIYSQVDSEGLGNAGGITINTGSLDLINGGVIDASTLGQGNAGEIKINANSVNLDNGTAIFTISASTFDAGDITLNVANSVEVTNSSIFTSSTQSSGGNLTISAEDIKLRGNSNITTSIFFGEGSGGNIAINADSIIAFDDSDIFASAQEGSGGNINLDTPAFFAENFTLNSLNSNPDTLQNNSRADVNATGAVSSGTVDIPDVSFIQNGLTDLPNNSINTDELVANSCVSPVGNRQQGKFIITGTESLPLSPGDGIPSKYPTGEVRDVLEKDSSWQPGDPIVEPQGAYRLANGKLVLSRQCSQ